MHGRCLHEFNVWTSGSLLCLKNDFDLNPEETHVCQYIPKFLTIETFHIHSNLARGMIVVDGDYKHKGRIIIATFKPLIEFLGPISYKHEYPLFV